MDAGRILLGTPRLPRPRWCAARMFQLRAPIAATCAGTRAPHLAMSRQMADKNVSPHPAARSACAPRSWARTWTQGTSRLSVLASWRAEALPSDVKVPGEGVGVGEGGTTLGAPPAEEKSVQPLNTVHYYEEALR